MNDILFGVSPRDPAVIAGAVAVLITVAFAANYLPARHAARADPASSLRT
jgi:ABC-type antimicrobial peptide transport system permease subunit